MSSEEKAKKLRVPPEALQVIHLDEIASRLADIYDIQLKILKHLEETTPEGVDFPIPEVTVTNVRTIDFLREYPYRKIRSIDIFNKGESTVYVRVNDEGKEIPIENREYVKVERPRATIRHITLRVDSGSATVRMIGHY